MLKLPGRLTTNLMAVMIQSLANTRVKLKSNIQGLTGLDSLI
tara:strand:+ start:7896 stop:8021 length:126 start_codon:yes stop_codon:yes gene_type:complete